MTEDMMIKGAEDLISNLPDGILQHMLCSIPIKLALSTSLLSRRWRHVWLSLSCCSLSDESMARILSGCPVLENLTLYHCGKLKVPDLSKSLRLKTLAVDRNVMVPEGPTKIVAPHIHYLRLLDSRPSCTLVDVASLTEAKLDVCYALSTSFFKSKADFLEDMVLKMLEKLQNAEKLTFGGNFVKILSLVEIRGVSFPMLKVKSLILDTVIYQYVIPGIQGLLQHSPGLEKLIVRGRTCSTIPEEHLDQYLKSLSLNPDQCWRSKDDEILQHILCFIPIKVAIKTSLLSKRWRHVWCDIPSLTLDVDSLTAASVTETLTHYTAPKTKIFFLKATKREDIPHIDQWIKCAMSHNVENLSLDFPRPYYEEYKPFLDLGSSFCEGYKLPGFFYNSSSFKQLNIKLSLFGTMVSECSGLTQIVAPHVHCLKLLNSQLPCTLVDVSSLTEAKLDICHVSMNPHLTADFLQVMALKMLEKFQNAEKLSFGGNFILILSLAEIRGVPFPMLKVKSLILHTVICQYVIPGIERLLQNSPDLEKLIVRGRNYNTIPEEHVDIYLKLKTLNPDQCWRSKDGFAWNKSCWNVQPKQVASFVELVLINTEKSLKLVVLLDERPYLKFKIEDLVATLPHNNNVTILLSTNKPMPSEECVTVVYMTNRKALEEAELWFHVNAVEDGGTKNRLSERERYVWIGLPPGFTKCNVASSWIEALPT
ncbi:hypothetical protein Bca52824_066133 [Brassica carinata]|uniref:F-box domain-containing protein n=1 Tax=Brassica carinata TaxID=52824 RepID=A0A8X7QPV3_BRACI|nr:hypothetical protein Bca52824_066133 [Brassica carinata]